MPANQDVVERLEAAAREQLADGPASVALARKRLEQDAGVHRELVGPAILSLIEHGYAILDLHGMLRTPRTKA